MLFILLLGSIVMLAQSVRVGAVDMEPARVGSGGISPIRAEDVRVIVVDESRLVLDDRTWADPDAVLAALSRQDTVLLVTADRDVRHHRVMEIWSALRHHGLQVKLGVEPAEPPDPADDSGES